jgi:hypothetical protein
MDEDDDLSAAGVPSPDSETADDHAPPHDAPVQDKRPT